MSGNPPFWSTLNEILRSTPRLKQAKVQASCRWVTKVVTTDPPKYVPHNLYSWEADLLAEEPTLATVLVEKGGSVQYAKTGQSSAGLTLSLSLSFWPHDWNHPGGVTVILQQQTRLYGTGASTDVDSESLSRDPKRLVETPYEGEAVMETGAVLGIARIFLADPVHAGLMLIARSDTESDHGQWRLKKRLRADMPSCLQFLKIGRYSGILHL